MKDAIRIHISTLSRIQASFQLTELRKEINQGTLCALEYAEEVECLRLRAVGNSAHHETRSAERLKEELEQDVTAALVEVGRACRRLA